MRTAICANAASKPLIEADVVVVGAGIIGLLTAHALLQQKLSVAVVERKQLFTGATGAGQGYIWMAHRDPSNVGWQLAEWSRRLWQQRVEQDPAFASAIEWQGVGSMLLASTADEAAALAQRQPALQARGVASQLLDAQQACAREPALALPGEGAALLTGADAQINGRMTTQTVLDRCSTFPGFQIFMDEPVQALHVAATGAHEVQTAERKLRGRLATVVAAGVWSGDLLTQATGQPQWRQLLQPRRGHLLELTAPAGMAPIRHGLMEMSYTKHYSHASKQQPAGQQAPGSAEDVVDITFTATTSASGSLLIGSSREFSGWDSVESEGIVEAIMQRAELFLPGLKGHRPSNSGCGVNHGVRVGLRPFAVGGLPIIGPVPGVQGLHVAAGHEGSGLCLGPATAELIGSYITGTSISGHEGSPSAAAADAFSGLLPKTRLATVQQA